MSNEQPKVFMEWQASEYIHHHKNAAWYLIYGLASVALIALLYLILRDVLSVIVIGLMAVTLLVFASRPPKTLRYAITDRGLEIGERKYAYESFKSFSVVNSGGIENILVDPMHRFMPPITIYFEPHDGQKVFEILSNQLPYNEYQADIVDKITEKIRF